MTVLDKEFFHRDCLEVASDLCGKIVQVKTPDGSIRSVRITETEAYRGEEDTACHASKGRTPRTELLYGECGMIYVYLCYGIHWLMNVITGEKDCPQGVLLRAGGIPLDGSYSKPLNGPAKFTKYLGVDKRFNGMPVYGNPDICITDDGARPAISTRTRVGIDYATEEYRNKLWRFVCSDIPL